MTGKTNGSRVLAAALAAVVSSAGPAAFGGSDWTPFATDGRRVATVVSHADPVRDGLVPKVLFFGTRCSSHGLTASALRQALNALKATADVDWHLLGNYAEGDGAVRRFGTLSKGGADVTSSTIGDGDFSGSEHYALRTFLERFATVLTDPATSNKYDYVVIETDGSRLANEYGRTGSKRDGTADAALEERVARLLLPFYAEQRVIWLMDNGWDYYHGARSYSYFGYVNDSQYQSLGLSTEIFQYGERCDGGNGRPYRVNNGVMKNRDKKDQNLVVLSDDQWKGLLAVFDPQLYLDVRSGQAKGRLYAGDDGFIAGATVFKGTSRTSTMEVDLYAGHPYANQTWYDDAKAMAGYLTNAVVAVSHPPSGDVSFADRIALGSGQTLTGLRVFCATNEPTATEANWLPLLAWEASAPDAYDCTEADGWRMRHPELGGIDVGRTRVEASAGAFSVVLTNVAAEVWLKAELTVVGSPVSSYDSQSFTVTPYVQHPSTGGMSIVYFTSSPIRSAVRCWPVGDETSVRMLTATGVEATDLVPTGHSSDTPVWGTQYRHRVRFEGLTSGATYRYEVELEDGTRYANAFKTAPGRDTPVRFVAYSDSETTPKDKPDTDGWDVRVDGADAKKTYYVARSVGYAANIRHMMAWRPDFIVIAGDLVARGGVQMFWDEFWRHNAGANAKGFNDPGGSTPILAAIGNHDFYDNKGLDAYKYSYGEKGERALRHYLSYFEYEPNGVDYANAAAAEKDERDKSQMFHRLDYGPVTLIFLDTNNGDDASKSRDTNTGLTRDGSTGARSPDFNEGTLQYQWLERNLSDARRRARFVFVVNHQCPYSSGKHNAENGTFNGDERETVGATAVRALTPLLHRYGVTAWLCGHDEIQEHSQHVGEETLADGTKRRHVLNVYDLGSAGDGLRGKMMITNQYEVFRAYKDSPDGVHYGHLQVEAKPNAKGVWQCTLTPMYSFMKDDSGDSELRAYKDRIVINENGTFAYEQRKGVTLVEGDGSVEVAADGAVTVSESVHRIDGVAPEKVKVVYSDGNSGESYDITGAFSVVGTNVTEGAAGAQGVPEVAISLNPMGAVAVGAGESVPVRPTLADTGESVEPFAVGEQASVGIKTIPGLTYRLKRSDDVLSVSRGEVVDVERARGTRTSLVDPMQGGRPEKAFYTIEVNAE